MTTKQAIVILDGLGDSSCVQCSLIAQILKDADEALNKAGCPTGNEHGEYSLAERITGMAKGRDYAWRQLDELRKKSNS